MQTIVDWRAGCSLVGTVCKYLAVPLVFPVPVALYYRESTVPFLVAIAATLALGTALERLDSDSDLGHREGFLMVSLTWLAVPLVGTIPHLVAGQGTVTHPTNALFESMSGFTTTGATVLAEISFERHTRSILLWRQVSQWLGGMGIVVLMVAILPELSVGGAQIIREEAPGITVEKLTPRIRETARALWKIYIGSPSLARRPTTDCTSWGWPRTWTSTTRSPTPSRRCPPVGSRPRHGASRRSRPSSSGR
jgi:trk system potassium uptake protein TrkH